MSATNPQRVNSHESRGNVSQTVTRFVDAVEDLAVELDAPDSVVNEFVDAGDELAELVEETAQTVEQNVDDIKSNAGDIEGEAERRSAEIEGCHHRISNVEDEIDDLETTGARTADTSDSDSKGVDDETTALERVCALPEHVVEDNLTANQHRARSIARRIEEYGRSVPAGVAITSSRIKRVLTAQEDTTIHRQTVSRVADFLERFGDGSVQIKETRGGKTTVVFDNEIVDAVTSVVTDNTGTGVTPATI
jgi:chemotaxis regulatin CheY-phosphate phosphatase CheZ